MLKWYNKLTLDENINVSLTHVIHRLVTYSWDFLLLMNTIGKNNAERI